MYGLANTHTSRPVVTEGPNLKREYHSSCKKTVRNVISLTFSYYPNTPRTDDLLLCQNSCKTTATSGCLVRQELGGKCQGPTCKYMEQYSLLTPCSLWCRKVNNLILIFLHNYYQEPLQFEVNIFDMLQ